MYRWVGALLKNQGAETLNGSFGPAAGASVGTAEDSSTAPLATFEISLLDELVRLDSLLMCMRLKNMAIHCTP